MGKNLLVSAFIDIYPDRSGLKSLDFCFKHFESMAASGIEIVLFISKNIRNEISKIIEKYDNVRVHKEIELIETRTWKLFNKESYGLPERRNVKKDTIEYITLMNCKTEFVNEIIEDERYNGYDGYGWIDFNIFHVISDIENGQKRLKEISEKETKIMKGVRIPGCWTIPGFRYNEIMNEIHWRFCGGIYIGSREKIEEMCRIYWLSIELIIEKQKKIVWEVNIWAIMEVEYGWRPEWFAGDHNDTILNI